MVQKKKKVPRTRRNISSPQIIEQRKQKRVVRSLFEKLAFRRVKSDGVEFKFQNRTGELDDIFLNENIIVLVEYTVGQATSEHVAKKAILFNLIDKHKADWLAFAIDIFPELKQIFYHNGYLEPEYQLRICYFSTQGVSDEIGSSFNFINFVDGTTFRYFDALARTIYKSARFEFFKFLNLDFKKIGSEIKNSSNSMKTFEGHVLPETFSSFPKGFKVVSFYADPGTLLTMSYVLRRDSWRDEEGMYQRVLQRGRMNQMRKYLTTEKRVFVNNIIVTLPNDTKLNETEDSGKNIDPVTITGVMSANITVPSRSNVIGIVDGQHRVFCYHEGVDKYEAAIRLLRDRQNLLVTGIIYPEKYGEVSKRRFEAKLFLEINDKQKRTGSELKQSIELILSPYSTIAIAKSVVQRLNSKGALKGFLQTNYFDPPNLIRTTSIVSYGLRPLVKLDGEDALFTAWNQAGKERLRELQKSSSPPITHDPILSDYVDYCVKAINDLLIAAKKSDDPSRWKLTEKAKDRHLSPTIINGFVVCLRLLVANGKVTTSQNYEARLSELKHFQFGRYKSSSWKALGTALYTKYFS